MCAPVNWKAGALKWSLSLINRLVGRTAGRGSRVIESVPFDPRVTEQVDFDSKLIDVQDGKLVVVPPCGLALSITRVAAWRR